MQVYLGCDHAALSAKEKIKEYLKNENIEVIDCGTNSEQSVHYPHFAFKVVEGVIKKQAKGILLCGSGIGMSIAANKFKGIRASLCHTQEDAKMTRLHNNSNILCLGARTTGEEELMEIVKIWMKTEFEGGRHQERIDLFKDFGSEL